MMLSNILTWKVFLERLVNIRVTRIFCATSIELSDEKQLIIYRSCLRLQPLQLHSLDQSAEIVKEIYEMKTHLLPQYKNAVV